MRKVGVAFVVGVIIVTLSAVPAWRQYRWASEALRDANANGWTLISSSDNYSDMLQPWTMFKQPINSMVFTKPEEIRRLQGEIIAAPTLWMKNRRLVDNGEDYQTWYLAACARGEIVAIDSSTTDPKALAWHTTASATPGRQVLEYLCSSARR